jgi:DNA-binding response OmpR family regulator
MAEDGTILVVDDEKNIRMTMVQALEANGYHVESAVNGEEALLMLKASPFDLLFLDLKMPGIDGIEVLRQTRAGWPRMPVVVITAHGTVDNAVEAMKLGAADFIQKPFTPDEIRALAASVMGPLPEEPASGSYERFLAESRRCIDDGRHAEAVAFCRRAIGIDPTRPEAFNLLGAAVHLSGQRFKAQDYFRAAIALDPTYKPAHENLTRSVLGGVRSFSMELALGDGIARTR